jgi:hypothetical protein
MSDKQNALLLTKGATSDYESDSGVPSAYEYDTSSDVDVPKTPKTKKEFKPSNKKKIQLTFENLTVSTIPKRKKLLFFEYGDEVT